jgi:hypothetical protein
MVVLGRTSEQYDPTQPVDTNLDLEAGAPILALEQQVFPMPVIWLLHIYGRTVDDGREGLAEDASSIVVGV